MNYRIVDLEQNTPEWMNFRKGKIGASMAPTIMNENPWKSPLSLWEDIVFDRKTEETASMKRGRELEPLARDWLNKKWGVEFKPAVVQSIVNGDLIASLDGMYIDKGEPVLVEIKCAGAISHAQAVSGTIPRHYAAQLQHQMNVVGVNKMYYLSYTGDDEDTVVLLAQRNKEYCDVMIREEMTFLQRLADFNPPDPRDSDWKIIEDASLIKDGNRLAHIKLLQKELEEEEDEIKSRLSLSLQHPRCKIGNIKAQKLTRKGPVDYGKIEALKEVNLEKYRKTPIQYWKFG